MIKRLLFRLVQILFPALDLPTISAVEQAGTKEPLTGQVPPAAKATPAGQTSPSAQVPPTAQVLRVHRDFSLHFRQTCCVFEDGTTLYAKGYARDPQLLDEIQTHRRKGLLPQETASRVVEMAEIARAWRGAQRADKGVSELLFDLLALCAEARASDFIVRVRPGAAGFYALVNDSEMALCDPRVPLEGDRLIDLLFANKDSGSRLTALTQGESQGFSVSPGDYLKLPEAIIKMRCERGPIFPDGQHIVCRLFYRSTLEGTPDLRELGLSEDFCAVMEDVAASGRGLIVMAAPTGEGKTTTLARTLHWLHAIQDPTRRIVTLEDPPEYEIPGVTQCAVPSGADGPDREEHFRKALNSFVRVNPATGMIGEIRDSYSAKHALSMVRTGHQIFTTLHETGANSILFRMINELGINPHEVCNPDVISLLIRQTLVTLLCPHCSLPADDPSIDVPPGLRKLIGEDPGVRFRNPEGCDHCRAGTSSGSVRQQAWLGYEKRIAVAEWIRPDARYLQFVLANDEMGARDYWLKEMGGVTIHEQISRLVLPGRGVLPGAGVLPERGAFAGQVDPRDARRKGITLMRPQETAMLERGAAE